MTTISLEPLAKLARDTRNAARSLGRDEGRYLVDLYYQMQEHRIALRGQERAQQETGEPIETVSHFASQIEALERQAKSVLEAWTDESTVSAWAKSQIGIGGVLAAGLEAHIDITRAHTAGAIWRFAGLDPSLKWGKGEKRPHNARLKTHCWKIGDSFVKVSGRDDAFYGQLYRQRKAQEVERNESGDNADAAAQTLEDRTIKDRKLRATYEAGLLPDGRVDLRARRWVVKLFLSHWHAVAYRAHHGKNPPNPYVITHLGHVDMIVPPGWPWPETPITV
jgi:hypothetical protein